MAGDERDVAEEVRLGVGAREPGGAPVLSCAQAEAHVLGDVAFVTCHEVLREGARLAATNVFVRERGGWRMTHHQATPIAPGQLRPRAPTGPAN